MKTRYTIKLLAIMAAIVLTMGMTPFAAQADDQENVFR